MNSHSEATIPFSHSLDTNDVMKGENNNSWLAIHPKLNAKSKRGYILFSAEVRKRVLNENPEAKFGEVSEIIGNEWKRLSDEDKRDYESRAQFIAAERAKAGLLTPNSKLPQHTITHQGWHSRFGENLLNLKYSLNK
uniref:HMG box domain-containing protein n=1 Tax=Meloidogyne incognita TaxID=6306 RepID=A0A914MFK3_MELIC